MYNFSYPSLDSTGFKPHPAYLYSCIKSSVKLPRNFFPYSVNMYLFEKIFENTNLGYTGGLKDDIYNKNVPDVSVATTDLLQGK